MFDAKRLLGQFIASQVRGGLGGTRAPHGGYEGRSSSSPLADVARSLGSGAGGSALAGGLASLLLGSKKGRRMGGSAAKLGGMALIGSLAYRAYQDWQAGQSRPAEVTRGSFFQSEWAQPGGTPARAGPPGAPSEAPPAEAPLGSAFMPAAEAEQQHLGRVLLRAMIAAAKADGHIDAQEQAAIFGKMDALSLDAEDKAFVLDEMRAPLDVDSIARSATSPEMASEIYAASLLAIDVDNPAERGYLALLAARLRIDDALVARLHATVEQLHAA